MGMHFDSIFEDVAWPEQLKGRSAVDEIVIHTDGSCWTKDRIGAYAARIDYIAQVLPTRTDDTYSIETYATFAQHFVWGQYHNITNNIAELLGIYHALAAIPNNLDGTKVTLYSDSEWAIRCLQGIYTKRMYTEKSTFPINWPMIEEQAARFNVEWKHVRGHNGTLENEQCDTLCDAARRGVEITEKVFRELMQKAQEKSKA